MGLQGSQVSGGMGTHPGTQEGPNRCPNPTINPARDAVKARQTA